MNRLTCGDVLNLIHQAAPFDTQEPWDNSGFLVGEKGREVTGILFALDVTQNVIDEAAAHGANLIVTHHPLMFDPIRRVTDETFEGRLILRLIREGVGLIACHTCLDRAPGGINDALAECCALLDVEGEGFVRVGTLPVPMPAGELREYLSAALGDTVRLMGDPARTVRRLGMCSGAGSGEWEEAATLGADAFLSGEVKHHHALAMADAGLPCFECGHFATEQPGIFALADALQTALNQVEYKLGIYHSRAGAYGAGPDPRQAD
ncbi:MAG: Nif3-like dinuclear metal center hexameric protein [Clostridia bacterium]|nr:Nif3-like dinuclear metal center hexameric protein [Clostridia bacterium]